MCAVQVRSFEMITHKVTIVLFGCKDYGPSDCNYVGEDAFCDVQGVL